jgi:hypothetical protein
MDFRAAGVLTLDLRWLLQKGYVQHLVESTRAQAQKRTFRRSGAIAFSDRSCFIITSRGESLSLGAPSTSCGTSRGQRPTIESAPHRDIRPRWDASARELWVGDAIVKRFRVAAPNEEMILSAFDEEGWPSHIDDPLPPKPGRKAPQRLRETIYALNQHQLNELLHFSGDGRGAGVCWTLAAEKSKSQ